MQELETPQSNWSKRRSQHQSRPLPSNSLDQGHFFIPSSLFDSIFPKFYIMKIFRILCSFFILLWTGKITPLFTNLRPSQMGVIQLPSDCWICHSAGDPVVLSETPPPSISNASVSLEQVQPPLDHVRLPNARSPFLSPYLTSS